MEEAESTLQGRLEDTIQAITLPMDRRRLEKEPTDLNRQSGKFVAVVREAMVMYPAQWKLLSGIIEGAKEALPQTV